MAKFSLVLLLALSVVALSSGRAAKISPSLASLLDTHGTANIVISFDGTNAILSSLKFKSFMTRSAKLTALRQSLLTHSNFVQRNVLSILSKGVKEYQSYWINNRIFVANAGRELVETLSSIPEVTEIREEKTLHLTNPISQSFLTSGTSPKRNAWGLVNIKSPEAWAAGFTGDGVVVATIDTGARFTHETLQSNFRGEYGWKDPYANSQVPNDNVGHGTHVVGTIAGAFDIGVAPNATWMACKGCNIIACTEKALTECGQWVACPTLPDGSNPRCDLAPQIVSNSWGGGQGDPFYNDVVAAWKNAGIVPIFANGNSGPGCGTANSPADQPDLIAVGSTNIINGISVFSSKGPSVEGVLKPDVSAPGTNIRSAFNTADDAYSVLSGTSMAAPHVSGVVALMFQANPNLTFEQVDKILKETSDKDLTSSNTNCGGISDTEFPNNSFGHGKVNAYKATEAAAQIAKTQRA